MKYFIHTLLIITCAGLLTACSTPEEKAAEYIESGNTLLEQGNLEKAAIEYKNALQINQNLPDAFYGIAQIHERKQEWRKAFAVLNQIRELNPKHIDGRIKLAQLLLASNQLDTALLDATEILEMAPGDARAHALMAAVQYRLDDFDGAKISISNSLSNDPKNDEAKLVLARIFIADKQYNEAHEVIDNAIAKNPENVSMYLMKIQAYSEVNDPDGVESVYLALIKQFPEVSSYQISLARFYTIIKDIDKAEKVLTDVVRNNPDSVDEKLRLIQFTRQYRSLDQSIAILNEYIQQDSDEYRYQFLLGSLYVRSDQPDKATATYQKIIDADGVQPNGLKARNDIALIELGAGNREEATRLINEVIAEEKNNESALLIQANFKIIDKQYADAIIDLRTVLRDNSDSIKALSLIARAYEAQGSEDLALENYLRAYRINPAVPLLVNRLAQYYIRTSQFDKANEVIEGSFSRGNRNLVTLKLFAQVKLALQDWEAAEKIAKMLEGVEGQEALSQQVMGVVYLGQEQPDESIEAFKRAHDLAPTASRPVVALVRTYLQSGKIEEAKKFLHSIIASDPDNLTAYTLLGQLSLYEKQPKQAETYFLKAIEINPELTASYRSLARIYLVDNKMGAAEEIIKRGLVALPGDPALTMSLASLYERQLEFEKAIDLYEVLIDANPDNIIANNNLASLLTDYRSDQASLDRAREIAEDLKDSQIPHFRDTYAWAQIKSDQQLEQAVVILEGIVKEVEKTAIFHYHLGIAYEKKGDSEKALAQMKLVKNYSRPNSDLWGKADQVLQQLAN